MSHVADRKRHSHLPLKRYREHVIYMSRDCHVCRSEGFEIKARVAVSLTGKSIAVVRRKELNMTIMFDHPARRYLTCRRSRRIFMMAAAAILLASSAFSLFIVAPAAAQTENGVIVSQGLAFYYAVIPAEMIRGHSKEHPEVTMHGGVPSRPHVHHVMVALFDEKTFDRVVDARVTASLGEIGFAGKEKVLEPFVVDGALTYGNYFDLRPGTEYLARISAIIPRRKSPARAEFQFKH